MPRSAVLLALVASLLVAGCIGSGPTAPAPAQSPTSTESPWDSTAPDLDHEVRVINQLNHSVDLRVFVINESGHHVYDENLTVGPGKRTVYNTNDGNPEEYERFRVVGVWNGTRDDTYLRMKNCHASALVTIREDDGLDVATLLC